MPFTLPIRSARNELHADESVQSIPTSEIITCLPYRDIISFIFARHSVLKVDQLDAVGYSDIPMISQCAPLLFRPSNIHSNRLLSYPLEICTTTLIEVSIALTAL